MRYPVKVIVDRVRVGYPPVACVDVHQMPILAVSPSVTSTVGLKSMVLAPLSTDMQSGHTYGTLQAVAGAIDAFITPRDADGKEPCAVTVASSTVYQ